MKKFKHKDSNVEAHEIGLSFGYHLKINGNIIGMASNETIEKDNNWVELCEGVEHE